MAVVLVLELGMIVLFDVTSFTHPAQTDIGYWLAPRLPDLLAVDGVGGVLDLDLHPRRGDRPHRSARRP